MGFDLIGPAVTLFLAGIAFIVWLVRLEGRINSAKQTTAELTKDLEAHSTANQVEIAAMKARADADSAAHSQTTIAIVRVQEQLKHLTDLVERLFMQGPPKPPRRGPES